MRGGAFVNTAGRNQIHPAHGNLGRSTPEHWNGAIIPGAEFFGVTRALRFTLGS